MPFAPIAKPSQIITRKSLENTIASVAASGGSTNAVLHLLAIARELGVELSIDDFDAISARTPYICSLTPAGKYVASDYQAAGGSRLLAKRMIDAGHADGSALTVSGKTLAEEAASCQRDSGAGRHRHFRKAHQAQWWPGDSERQPRARRLRDEDCGGGQVRASRAGTRV